MERDGALLLKERMRKASDTGERAPMSEITVTIDGKPIRVPRGSTILEAARKADIYIPALCSHPDLPSSRLTTAVPVVYQGGRRIENARPEQTAPACGLCVVEVEGSSDLVASCSTEAEDGMVVVSENARIRTRRRENLVPLLARHPHACLTCVQKEGCDRSSCSANVPERERCCPQFGRCELQAVVDYVGISDVTPRWVPTDFPVFDNDPLFVRDPNLCIGCTRCVRACRDLRGVEAIGYVRDEAGLVQVGTLAPTLQASGCRFCTACVEVCPTGALVDKRVRPGKRDSDLVPCREACPAHVDVPEYLRLIAEERPIEADAVIRERVPFPGVLGRVCTHPCEAVCRRADVNQPVAICALKRYAADMADGGPGRSLQPGPDTGKKVAVIGAGPAGLTVACFLRKAGHGVTIFEAREEAGGMMRYGIPAYRLPRDVLDREIRDILGLGVDFQPGKALGRDVRLADLQKRGFDAVFLGVGAQVSRTVAIEGSDLSNVLGGVDFLGRVNRGEPVKTGKQVVVIGGGNVAVDAALTALRCGADQVTMACLEGRGEMPAHEEVVEDLLEEGVRLMPSWGPCRILSEKGRVTGVELVRCVRVFDGRGDFHPAFDEQTRETVAADQVILSVGQSADLSFLEETEAVRVDRGLIVVERDTQETSMPGVYAGGDAAGEPGAVIHAVAAGQRAAAAINRALSGAVEGGEVSFGRGIPKPLLGREEGFADRSREAVPKSDPASRSACFEEVSLGLDAASAVREASRCLQCDLRLFMERNPSPPKAWMSFTDTSVARVPETEGVYRLISGERRVLAIRGTVNLQESLLEELEENQEAAFFDFEEDTMYSRRETELIQQYLRQHGEMPGGGEDDDDLF